MTHDRRAEVAAGLSGVRSRIEAAGGDADKVAVLAVTKGHGPDAVLAAAASGLIDVGESYAQELSAKAAVVDTAVRWHMIGRVQRNKVRQVAGLVHLWQSVDRLPLATEVARHSPSAAVLVQVNVTQSPAQAGVPPAGAATLVQDCRDLGLQVRGLMAIGPTGSTFASRAAFAEVRELADRLGLAERSMGMSDDLEAAVAEGSTMVRIGTALFGPREGYGAVGN